MPERTLRRRAVFLLLPLWLAGCGGGISIGFGFGGDDDDPPSVSLAVTPASVVPGGTLQLAAAATDDWGVDEVRFYRIDGDFEVLLGSDIHPPYAWSTTAPDDGRGTLLLFARAIDGAGQRADSAVVEVPITPP